LPEIVKLRDKLEREAVGCFELIGGIIYRKNDAGRLCLYAPTQIQEQLIRLCYEKLGHLGVDKCVDDLKVLVSVVEKQSRILYPQFFAVYPAFST